MEKKEQYWQRALQLQVLVVETHTVSLGKGNVMITNLFIAEKAAGTWSVYMTGTNMRRQILARHLLEVQNIHLKNESILYFRRLKLYSALDSYKLLMENTK